MRYPAKTTALLAIGMFVLASVTLQTPWVRAQSPQKALVLIGAKDLGVSDVPLAAVRRVFGGETTDVNGKRLTPLNYVPGDPLRVSFDLVVLKLNPTQVGRFWIDRRIRGLSLPPRTVPSQRVMRKLIGMLAGQLNAIGYVAPDELDATVQPLKVDGKAHTDAGYPLLVPTGT